MKQNKSTQDVLKGSHSTSSSKRYKIICTPNFLTEARIMVKKYHNIKADFFALRDQFRIDPITGNDFLGDDTYKVRMPISDKNKGQSGGARVIIKVKVVDRVVYVVSVYDKSVDENRLVSTLRKLIAKMGLKVI